MLGSEHEHGEGATGAQREQDLASTAELLGRVRGGDLGAREELFSRYLPLLRRWAHGRLPVTSRALSDTDDLVQVTLIRALSRLKDFEPRREGAFLAYLRRILLNALRDEIRRSVHRRGDEALTEEIEDTRPSLLEETIGREAIASYEAALAALPEAQQEAIILRIEFGYTHAEIAQAVGSPSANAARMLVSRALVRLSEMMSEPGGRAMRETSER
jgi:RNA polymerase sigma-70 factor, ECF subfamily